jgi:hypothetical protein
MTIALSIPREIFKKRKTPAQIVNKYIDDPYCLELLRFFGSYPMAKFSELAVIHAQSDDSEKSRLRSALGRLVMNRIVGVCIEKGNHLYKLTDDESVHDSVVRLAKIEWRQWRKVLGRGNGANSS